MNDYYDGQDLGNPDLELQANRKNVPVKTHIKKIEENLAELKKDLNNNRQVSSQLTISLIALEARTKERLDDLTKLIKDDINNLDKDFKKVQNEDKINVDFFRQQVSALIVDKNSIENKVNALELRVSACEIDIGCPFNHDKYS